MKHLKKYKYSRLALLLWTALVLTLGYGIGSVQHAEQKNTDRMQQASDRMVWSV